MFDLQGVFFGMTNLKSYNMDSKWQVHWTLLST